MISDITINDIKNKTKYPTYLSEFGNSRLNRHNFLFDIDSSRYKISKSIEPSEKKRFIPLFIPLIFKIPDTMKTVIENNKVNVR
jgi:hypothetical protein